MGEGVPKKYTSECAETPILLRASLKNKHLNVQLNMFCTSFTGYAPGGAPYIYIAKMEWYAPGGAPYIYIYIYIAFRADFTYRYAPGGAPYIYIGFYSKSKTCWLTLYEFTTTRFWPVDIYIHILHAPKAQMGCLFPLHGSCPCGALTL